MAVEYSVCPRRGQRGGYSRESGKDLMNQTYSVDYDVIVSDPADPGFNPAWIYAFDVLNAPGLPITNQTTWYNSFTNLALPFVVCRSKEATQDTSNPAHWTVSTRWDSGTQNSGEDNGGPPPANLTDITPREDVRLGEIEMVIYEDFSATPKQCRLPTGNDFTEPFIERIPTLELRLTQFEPSITYQQMLDRKFKVNQAAYRGTDPYTWMIADVEGVEQTVQLAAGPTTAASVTYTIVYSPHVDPKDGTVIGWRDQRALVDSQFLTTADDKKTKEEFYSAKKQSRAFGFLNLDGTKATDQDQPIYDTWETFRTTDFSAFLQA